MEVNYKTIKYGRENLYTAQTEVTTIVNTAERGGASKLLSVEAESKINTVELLEGEANICGKVNYKVLYLDGDNKLCGLDYFKDFTLKMYGKEISAGDKWRTKSNIVQTESKLNGDSMELNADLDILLMVYSTNELKVVADVGDAECLEKEVITQAVQEKREEIIELSTEENVGAEVEKTLLFSTCACIKSISEDERGKVVTGEANAQVIYTLAGGATMEKTFTLPFSEVASGDNFAVSVKSARIVLSGDEEGSIIAVEIALLLASNVYANCTEKVVADCFAHNNFLELQKEGIGLNIYKGQRFFAGKIKGSLAEENVRGILSVRPIGNAVANVAASENLVTLEGVISLVAICETEEGYSSQEAELPYSFEVDFEGANAKMFATACVSVCDAAAVISNSEIAFSATLCANISLFETGEQCAVTDVAKGAEKPENDAGISVYFAEAGDTLWDIAKSMNVSPTELLKANPFLSEPLDDSKRVLIFRTKE